MVRGFGCCVNHDLRISVLCSNLSVFLSYGSTWYSVGNVRIPAMILKAWV